MCIPVQSSSRFLMVTHLSVFKLDECRYKLEKGSVSKEITKWY